jgi:hypothetical protein
MRDKSMKTLFLGFIGGLILWVVVYALINYAAMPAQYHDFLASVLSFPAQAIVIIVSFLKARGLSIVEPSWFFIQPISWGLLGALLSLAVKIIKF